jgi:hypothetical protein
MSPSGTLVSYKHTHLSLFSCCIEDWAFLSSRAFTYLLFTFCTLFLLQTIHPKTPKLLFYYYYFLVDAASASVCRFIYKARPYGLLFKTSLWVDAIFAAEGLHKPCLRRQIIYCNRGFHPKWVGHNYPTLPSNVSNIASELCFTPNFLIISPSSSPESDGLGLCL